MLEKILYNKASLYLAKNLIPVRNIRRKTREHIKYKIEHPAVYDYLNTSYIKPFLDKSLQEFEFKPKKHLDDEKIIWQLWFQGKDKAPLLVNKCFSSVEKYMGGDFKIIILDEDSIKEYVDFPPFIYQKINENFFGEKTITFFSDLLRLVLLYIYGGVWIDSTVFLSDKIPDELLEKDFFCFYRGVFNKSELDKVKHSRYFSYGYFNYNDDFKVRMLSSFIIAKKHNNFAKAMIDILMNYWYKDEGKHHYYFLLHIIFELLKDNGFSNSKYHISDFECHLLQFHSCDKFDEKLWQEIKEKSFLHKLTYFKDIKEDSMVDKIVLNAK